MLLTNRTAADVRRLWAEVLPPADGCRTMFGVEALCCLVDVSAFCARKRWRRQNRRCT